MIRSKQEQIVHQLSQGQIGAPFIFFPQKWKKPSGLEREPCDIVIACNNCIVLIYMTSSNQSKIKKISHNIRQAKGWIKVWKAGKSLIGSNDNFHYKIKFGDYKHIVVISIINCSENLAENHENEKQDFNIETCITIPQPALEYFAATGAGLVDLLKISKIIQTENKLLNALELMKSYFKNSSEIGDPKNIEGTYNDTFKSSVSLMKGVRSASLQNKILLQAEDSVKNIYNDLYLHDFIKICVALTLLIEDDKLKGKSKKEIFATIGVPVTSYIYIININIVVNTDQYNQLFKAKDDIKLNNQHLGVPIIFLLKIPENLGYSSILVEDKSSVSNCENLYICNN